MDTRTGQLTYLSQEDAEEAQRMWDLWLAGVLDKMPQFEPMKDDKVTIRPKQKKVRKRRPRSYFCN